MTDPTRRVAKRTATTNEIDRPRATETVPDWFAAVDHLARRVHALETGRVAALDDEAVDDMLEATEARVMYFVNDHAALINAHSRHLDDLTETLEALGRQLLAAARRGQHQRLGISDAHGL